MNNFGMTNSQNNSSTAWRVGKEHFYPLLISVVGSLITIGLAAIAREIFGLDSVYLFVIAFLIFQVIIHFVAYYFISRNLNNSFKHVETHNQVFIEAISTLASRVTQVTWIDDDNLSGNEIYGVYKKMVELVKDPRIKGLRILSIFQPNEHAVGPNADYEKEYYNAIENALLRPDFKYHRIIVLRRGLEKDGSDSWEPSKYFLHRPNFRNHILATLKSKNFPYEGPQLKFFKDDGRILDVAFAIFFLDSGFNEAHSLVIEITVRRSRTNTKRLVGILVIDTPGRDLVNSFNGVFNDLFGPLALDVEEIKINEIMETLEGTTSGD